jgi:hypothetical protein
MCHIKHRILTHRHRELHWPSFLLGTVSKEDQKVVNSFRRNLTWKLQREFSNRDLFNHPLITYVHLSLRPIPQKPKLLLSADVIKLSSPNSDQALSGACIHINVQEESKAGSDSSNTSKTWTFLAGYKYTSLNLIQLIVL